MIFNRALSIALLFASSLALAEGGSLGGGGGQGGPLFEYHFNSVASFDPALSGNPLVIGGVGFGYAAKNFRLGGGGAGGFLWNPSENIQFGMGYGGAIGEYLLTPWLAARLLIGGGGYAVAKVVTQTDTTTTLAKLSSGGFVLFYPSVVAEIPVQNWFKVGVTLGYFLPNVAKLQSLTMGLNFLFGKI